METTIANKDTFDQIYNVGDFYDNFEGEYTESNMNTGKSKRRKSKPPFALYKKVLITFFDIHAKELYFMKRVSYHVLGGDIIKTVVPPKVLVFKNGQAPVYKKSSIGLIWYNKPTDFLVTNMNFKKQVGGTSKLGKIEKAYRKNHDIDLLPKFDDEINRLKPKKRKSK